MLFEKRFWSGIADGTVTVTFRRWKRPQAVAGRSYRTAAGIIDVHAVSLVEPRSITDDDARAAGYPDAASLVSDLRGEPGELVHRVEFSPADRPDPRAALAADAELDGDDVAAITRRLDRLDRASSWGPWTRPTLELIAANPARRAGDLAGMAGRERDPFKLDVRKLKNLGLTESLDVGYRLSPRGRAYLDATR
ncbi:hypothetical protein [Haloactinopolyspora alba]|uniref:hypothetical protein n=1 Tax=Haloactinopolyspora alba TaxID=648780 RepID=UPI000D0DAE85|nr:hypothetical protein [Haloactinopolyspora alba]